ncbi:hypothetical protein [Ralstonia phage phiRSL1]|uniref:Uncharacterized protein n=1 Tax=Ralstonia phage phiRSL1 TaxID=1980924 RepID=B2ZYE2_9CAUD|nr:hypothetical protein RSL1_ORF239 [Ralstonia phage phiRSL1]BAG41688.1 hypothetical protein [Ralstonia phage phiRSL1]
MNRHDYYSLSASIFAARVFPRWTCVFIFIALAVLAFITPQ